MSELVLKTNWVNPSQRKLQATKACLERDLESLFSLLNSYITARGKKRANTSAYTRTTYELGLRTWLDFCWPDPKASPEIPLLRAGSDDVDRFIAHLQSSYNQNTAKPLAASTISTYLSAVRSFYHALIWAGASQDNPASKIIAPSDPTPAHEKRPAVDLTSYTALCQFLESSEDFQRDLVMVRLFGDAGLRISEVASLNLEDIHLADNTLEIRSGKGGKAATQFMTQKLSSAIKAWLPARASQLAANETALLINLGKKTKKSLFGRRMSTRVIRKTINDHFRFLGLPNRYHGTHTLRHTAGTRFYRATKDLHQTREFMRHSAITTTAIYAKMDKDMLRKGIEALDKDQD